MHDPLETACIAADAADGKKAFDILILDIRNLSTIADYFVICSGGSSTHIGAIADGIGEVLAVRGAHPSHIEGLAAATWVLMDYGDVIVHIFDDQTRAYYGLERLWSEARRVTLASGMTTVGRAVP